MTTNKTNNCKLIIYRWSSDESEDGILEAYQRSRYLYHYKYDTNFWFKFAGALLAQRLQTDAKPKG